jgi:hypothetical protein
MLRLAAVPIDLSSPVAAVSSLRARMVSHEDHTSAEVRRANREPWHVKQLRLFLHTATTEHQRNVIHKKLIRARWDFYKTIAEQGAALRVARGGVIAKKQHLWPLQGVIATRTARSAPIHSSVSPLGCQDFSRQMGRDRRAQEHADSPFSKTSTLNSQTSRPVEAVYACKKKSNLDHFGICSQALAFAVITRAGAWATFFSRLANDSSWLQSITVKGPHNAKASGAVLPENTRTILPQPVFLHVLRNLLCGRMRDQLKARMKQIGCSNVIMGGTGGLQVMDLIQPAQLLRELALDNGSKWSAASGDIQQYYEMVPPKAM